jgi:hypothetical protein
MLDGAVFIVGIVEKAAKGQLSVDVFGMPLEEAFVFASHAVQTLLDAQVQGKFGIGSGGLVEGLGIVGPAQNVLFGGVVIEENFIIFVLHGVIGIDD